MFHFTTKQREIALKYADYEMKLAGNCLVFQPRDGTRYTFVFDKMEAAAASAWGCMEEAVLVTYLTGQNKAVSATFATVPHPDYVREKLGTSIYTSKVISKVMEFVMNETDIGPFPMEGTRE